MTSPLEALIERLRVAPALYLRKHTPIETIKAIRQMMVERVEAADALAAALRVTEPAEAVTKLCDWYVPEAMPLPVTLPLPQKRQDPNDPPSVTLDDRFFRNIAHWRQTGKERG